MSIGVGTLKPKVRIRRPVLLAGLVAVVAVFTMSVIGANSTDESARPVTAVGRANANTPTELSGGIAAFPYAGIAVNTPTEMRYAGPAKHGTAANTPTELSGGLSAPAGLSYVPFVVNGEVFWRTVP